MDNWAPETRGECQRYVVNAHITHRLHHWVRHSVYSVTKWEREYEKFRMEPKIEPLPRQVLHAQGDNELTTVTQKALPERQKL